MTRSSRVLCAILYGLLAVFIAIATHNFFAYVGHYPYWSIDDGLGVLSTSWLQTGRYGDPSVPIEGFSDVQRYRGFFNYGPWSFATGAAVTWLFGFSVPALRALHLIAALSLVFVGTRLFSDLRGAVATTVLGTSVCYAVVQIEWPMFRPDAFVTLFAGGLIWSAAAATRGGRLRYWFTCGLAAGCGALSHLIAASLFPASLIALVAGVTIRRRSAAAGVRATGAFTRPVGCLVLGWLASALMFYASVGFRFKDHVTILRGYRSLVLATTATAFNSTGPIAVWSEHYRVGTSGVPGVYLLAVVVALALASALIGRALRVTHAAAIDTVALLVPGCAILVLYVASLGFYPNFHTGYVILPHLIGLWVVASTLYVVLGETTRLVGLSGRIVEPIVAIAVALLVARSAYGLSRVDDDPRIALSRSWIAISSYLDEVLGPLPRHAVAWGAAPFAVEGPARIQLISLETVLWMMARIPAEQRAALAPDYLVWGHPQSQDAVVYPFAQPELDPLTLLPTVLPQTEFLLASVVSGAPYGVTRVYQRRLPDMPAARQPSISVWDAAQQRWLHDTTPLGGVAWRPAAGSLQVTKGSRHWTQQASDAVAANLPEGWYVFRVALMGDPSQRQMMTASLGSAHDYIGGDLPPAVDVAARLSSEPIYLLRHHDGGVVGVNLYAAADVRIGRVDTFQVGGLADYRLNREQLAEQPLPGLSAWVPDAPGGVTVAPSGAALNVSGNASAWGYQLVSPRVDVTPGAEVSVRLPITTLAGRVCTGILDERQQQWLERPLDQAETHRFQAGANHSVFVVVSNCNGHDGTPAASRFTVAEGRYAVFGDRWYVDTLMRAFTNRPH